jgi:hypothetical protein
LLVVLVVLADRTLKTRAAVVDVAVEVAAQAVDPESGV